MRSVSFFGSIVVDAMVKVAAGVVVEVGEDVGAIFSF